MNITNQLGQITELRCQLDFCERGIVLSQPTNPSSRYDFIAEINNKLYRIQCKTAHEESNDRISIRTISKNWNNGDIHNYIGEIDYFYTNWNNKGYLIPIELFTETNKTKFLRLGEETQYIKNNSLRPLYGKDYEIDVILKSLGLEVNLITIESSEERQRVKEDRNNVNKCINCGKIIKKTSTRCTECYKVFKRPEDIPSRNELKTLIRTFPFTKIGEKYGRTDNAIRKWCDKYSLPRTKADIDKISDLDWELI